jgi:4-carboxymuconolactone decarboxylase
MNWIRLVVFATLCSGLADAEDRMPPIAADKLSPAQKKARELLAATPRGNAGNAGPFVPLLRSPEFMNRLQAVGDYLRFNNAIPQKLVEMTILMTARLWTQNYEWAAHYPLALKAGLKAEIAGAIAEGRRPSGMSDEEDMIWDFNTELLNNRNISDTTYSRILHKFGEQGVIDLTGITGYYQTLAMVMSVAQTPSQPNANVPALMPYRK